MSNYGFRLIKLELKGEGLPTAEITFKKGLNVITGASDTGKSFILQCIDYILGADTLPKRIDEAKGYQYIYLIIEDNKTNLRYTLKRHLNKKSVITLSTDDGKTNLELKSKSDAKNKDNISTFLLNLMELSNKKLKKNKNNETLNLSFRDIAHLFLISEEKIITNNSPVLSSNVVNNTKEKSVFSLLLTGEDDSDLEVIEDTKTATLKKDIKIEVLEELIEQYSNDLEDNLKPSEIESQISKLTQHFKDIEKRLNDLKYSVSSKESERQELWESVQSLTNEIHTKKVLIERFQLLDKKYESDLKRLNATIEANSIFDGLKSVDCFFCGAVSENHNQSILENYNADEIENACLKEIQNIRILQKELIATLNEIEESSNDVSDSLVNEKRKLRLIEKRIEEEIKPKINILLQESKSAQDAIYEQRELLSYAKRIESLKEKINSLENSNTDKSSSSLIERQINEEINQLCLMIEDRVKTWELFEDPRIGFNNASKIYDITISGKERGGYGKGYRALTYSAFSLSLLEYCQKNKMPHPMFVVLDSPLVVYKAPKHDPEIEGRENSVKYNFFKEISSEFKKEQVIIFENVEVPTDLKAHMHLIEFSGNKNIGRFGFIPIKKT